MFLQRKIMSRLHGEEYFDFDAILGWDHLKEYVMRIGEEHAYTVLRPVLEGVDPDDSFSVVPYEKGFNFICYLESVVGDKAEFEKWLHDYIQTFKHKAITTDDMLNHLVGHFTSGGRNVDFSKVDFKAWLDEPGMPPSIPGFKSALLDAAVELAEAWKAIAAGGSVEAAGSIDGWETTQICCFLNRVDYPVPTDVLTAMDKMYKFNSSTNSEVLFLWLTLCTRNKWTGHEDKLKSFLSKIGRMKFTRPLYRELKQVDKDTAVAIFKENRERYHNICSKMVAKDLGLE
eukprot:TRINITY_DN3287_c0_g1_i3.p2 TRINITY_DN3287_c0_g1~~TRINITY_DN3287_c0_g1_i3.p2  ORF type:complete len:287 (+),score=120.67 TRINITY_DN3287_c0_g1_i3:1551-2411(+)